LVIFKHISSDKDVSTIRFLSQNWAANLANAAPPKKKEHRAMDDIRETIAELRYYKESLWKIMPQHPEGPGHPR